MNKNIKFYWKLFLSTFTLSAFTFGGGYVIIPLMRKKFVDQYGWIDENEMMDLTCIAQSSPGAIAVNASILIGYRLAGFLGAMITVLGTVLPPLITLSVVSLAYSAFQDSQVVQHILKGMQAGVAAVIVDVVITMARNIGKERKILPLIVMISAFFASFVYEVNVIIILLISGVIGAASMYYSQKREKRGDKK